MLPYQNLSLEDMPGEIWKDIPGWEEYYQASTSGRIKSISHSSSSGKMLKNRILRQTFRGKGYLQVRLYKNGISYSYHVARLVLMTFVPNSTNKPTVDHINNDKMDNRVDNLCWATYHENMMNPISRCRRVQTWRIKYPPKENQPDKRIKPITALNLRTHEIVKFNSIKETSTRGFKPAQVSSVCCGRRNSLFGWKFFYADDPELKSHLAKLSAPPSHCNQPESE